MVYDMFSNRKTYNFELGGITTGFVASVLLINLPDWRILFIILKSWFHRGSLLST